MSNFDLQSRNNSSWTIEGLRNIQALRTFIKRIHFTTKPPRSYLIVGIIFVMITVIHLIEIFRFVSTYQEKPQNHITLP